MLESANIPGILAAMGTARGAALIATFDGTSLRAVRLTGQNPWHFHHDYDEGFYVIEGNFVIEFEAETVHLSQGDFFSVPRGLKHRGSSEAGASLLRFEKTEGRTTVSQCFQKC